MAKVAVAVKTVTKTPSKVPSRSSAPKGAVPTMKKGGTMGKKKC